MNIGIVEDNPAICGLLYEILELWGHRPFIYRTGWSFFEHLFSQNTLSFDVVLVDLMLPREISGMQVIQTIRANVPSVPLLVVSGVSSHDLGNVQKRYPEVTTIQKPFSLSKLRSALEQATEQRCSAHAH